MQIEPVQLDSKSADARKEMIRGLIANAVVDGLGPLLVYQLAVAHMSELHAIGWSMAPPVISNAVSVGRKKRLDIIGSLVIAGIVAALVLNLFGGSARLLLVRDSLITGVIGLLFLGSLMFPRPLVFYIVRQIRTAHDAASVAKWDESYAQSKYKFGIPIITAVWGAGLAIEAAARITMVFTLAIPVYLAVSPVVNFGVYAGLIFWSFRFGSAMRNRETQTQLDAHSNQEAG